jgi:hypothetical protein
MASVHSATAGARSEALCSDYTPGNAIVNALRRFWYNSIVAKCEAAPFEESIVEKAVSTRFNTTK